MTKLEDTDRVIHAGVVDELRIAPSVDDTDITVAVHRGSVTLSGKVGTYPERRRAEKAVLRIHDVNAVMDELTVRSAL